MMMNPTKLFVPLALLVAGTALGAPTRQAVERLLGGYEPRATPAAFQRLGDGTDRVLIAIALDPTTPGTRRARALTALGHVPSDAGRALCRQVIKDEASRTEGREVLDVRACAIALGSFGPSAAADLVPLLDHPAFDVRLGAARGLEKARAPESAAALRQRLAVEPDETVRAVLDRALRALETK